MTQFSPERAVGATDVGRRSHNEDAYLLQPETGLVLVADGVGGHHAGEVASAITCDTISASVNAGESLEGAVRAANRAVMEAVSSGDGKQGMASTVVAAKIGEHGFELAWVGDSRAYLWDGQLKLLTRDHSLVERLVASGEISRSEVREHPQRNVIIQAIGLQSESSLRVDTNQGSWSEDAVLILCSDGMSDVLDNAEIVEIVSENTSLQSRCDMLVETSIANGGKDNSTVILVEGGVTATEAIAPRIVWSFDPNTGRTEGLEPETTAQPRLRKVSPRNSEEDNESPRTTQMMSVAEVERELARRSESGSSETAERDAGGAGRTGSTWVMVLTVAVLVAGAAAYFLVN